MSLLYHGSMQVSIRQKVSVRTTLLTMVFCLCLTDQRRWRRLDGQERLAEVIEGVSFVDGLRQERIAA